MVRAPWALVLLCAWAGPAAGQSPLADFAVQVEAPKAPIVPDTGVQPFDATFSVSCPLALRHDPLAGVQVRVTFSIGDANAFVQGPAVVWVPTAPCLSGQGSSSATIRYEARANRLARGVQPIEASLEAETEPPERGMVGRDEARAGFFLLVEYFPDLRASAAQPTVAASPGRPARFQVQVENEGNAETHVEFAMEPADLPGRAQWILPAPILLEPSGAGRRQTVEVLFVPGPEGRGVLDARLLATPSPAADPERSGAPAEVLLRAVVGEASVPDAGPLAALALLAAAVAARRRA